MRRRFLLAKLHEVNGVVLPSLLKPGQPPFKSPSKSPHKGDCAGNYNCPICCDSFNTKEQLKVHFVPCVQRNGNPHGYHWNYSFERGIGKETAEQYCEKDCGRDQNTEASTSEVVSSDNPHTISYEPSESCNPIQSSSPYSLELTPRLRHERSDYTEAPPVARTRTDHGFGSAVIGLSDEESAGMDFGTAQPQVCGSSNMDCRSANVCFRAHGQSSLETYKCVHIVCLVKASSRHWSYPQVRQMGVTRAKLLW